MASLAKWSVSFAQSLGRNAAGEIRSRLGQKYLVPWKGRAGGPQIDNLGSIGRTIRVGPPFLPFSRLNTPLSGPMK